MKQVLLILFSLIIFTKLISADVSFYYYNGQAVQLEEREDKLAVILEGAPYSPAGMLTQIKSRVMLTDTVKQAEENVLIVTLSRSMFSRVNSVMASLTNLGGVKFVTKVYYGTSRRVTQVPTDEFIVRLRDESYAETFKTLNITNKCTVLGNVGDKKGFLLRSNSGVQLNALELANIYYNSSIFEFAEPNFLYPDFCLLNYTPNDPFYTSQWALNSTGQSVSTGGNTSAGDGSTVNTLAGADMRLSQAWDHTLGSSLIEVGVFDTGIDSTHPDFQSAGHLLAGYDAYYNKYGVPRDSGSHGTCTAGLIGAVTNNSTGVAGIAPNCKLMAFRIFNSAGSATDVGIARGFDSARVKGIDVLSNSWGGGTPLALMTNAINNAATLGRGGLGCIILFSSGNDGRNPPAYPSYLPNVICVGASTTHDQKKAAGTGNQYWWGGNYGDSAGCDIELVAPTVCYSTDVQSTGGYNTSSGTNGNYYAVFNGTSASCPNAAGVAALVLSVNTSFTRTQVTQYLLLGCDKIDNVPYSTTKTYGKWNSYMGYGRVNAYNSVRLAAGVDITPPSINHTAAASHNSTYPTTILANITDQDGSTAVPTTGVNRPRLYYRTNKNNAGWSAFTQVYFSSNSGSNFYFQIPCVGWETEVQYYIEASDNSSNTTTFPRGSATSGYYCYYAVGSLTEVTGKTTTWNPPDNNAGISGSVNFANFKILNTKVRIYLRHTWVSDNILYIWSPITDNNNNRKCLFDENGFNGDNITGATVSDSASQFWFQGTPPYTNGTYYPEYTMRGYNGTSASGNWRFVNLDIAAGDAPTYDSIRITFVRTLGTLSSSARLNSQADSVVDFGTVPQSGFVDRNFYLKNSGNSNLTVSAVNFTGSFSADFYLTTALPGPIAPGDSALFTIRAENALGLKAGRENTEKTAGNQTALMPPQNGVMNISTNDPSKPTFMVSLQTDYALPVTLTSFDAYADKKDVRLKWVTTSELNNHGFEVHRQGYDKNGKALAWVNTGFVEGNGTTNEQKVYNFTDKNPGTGKYKYRLKQVDYNGSYEYHNAVNMVEVGRPQVSDISQNYPNPSNPISKIDYQVSTDADVNISVYDLTGRLVKTLVNMKMDAGYYSAVFDGSLYASGIYIYRMTVSGTGLSYTNTRKLVLVK